MVSVSVSGMRIWGNQSYLSLPGALGRSSPIEEVCGAFFSGPPGAMSRFFYGKPEDPLAPKEHEMPY
jgi:hypothetical protein